jgi:NitT/TauT family transport system substrate-binding protein/sulfonate transport system substrate-binding protein
MLIVSAVFIWGGLPTLAAEQFNTAWQSEHESFITWYAKEKGWDKETGLDFNLVRFDSGMAMLEALPEKRWMIGALGATPAVVGAARYGTKIIAVGNDEAMQNVVLARSDSPIMKVKGWNSKYPNVYGSPELIEGKTIICSMVSSGHFVLSQWLKVFDLKESDVIIKNMDPFQSLAAFESGIGDAVTLWAPHMHAGMQKGWQIAGDIKDCGAGLPVFIIGDPEFLDKNPDAVVKFLKIYFRGIDMLKSTPVDKLVPEYKEFMKDYCGLELTDEMCKMDLEGHPVFTLQEQIEMMSGSPSVLERWELGVLDFFTAKGKLKKEYTDKVLKDGKLNFITDEYLRMIEK